MSDTVLIALIAALPGLFTFILQMMNRKVALETKAQVIETHALTNSKMTELIAAEKGQSRAEGNIEGQDKQRGITDAAHAPNGV